MPHSPSLSPLRRLLDYGGNYQRMIYQAIVCSVLNKIFDLAPPVLIGAAVDVVVQQENSIIARWGIEDSFQQLLALAVVSGVIWVLESVFEYAYQCLWRNLAQNIENDLRIRAYGHLQDLDLAFFEERSTGDLLAVLNDDINQLERFLDVGANELLQVLTTVIVVGGLFFWFTPDIAWLTILPIPFILWGSIGFKRFLAPRYGAVREQVSLLSARLANNISGITTIKSFTTEQYEIGRLRQESEAYRRSNQRAIALSAAFVPLIRMVILGGFTAILLAGGQAAIAGDLAVGSYSVLVFMTQRLLWPLTSLGNTLDLYQRAMASVNRVAALLETQTVAHPGHLPLAIAPQGGAIAFDRVTFGYQNHYPIVKNLSLEIPAGETVAIVGATGSGKSTLVKLLLRFYEIQGGTITLDGQDIRQIFLGDLRKNMGLVSQDVFLFHGTVAENIAYGTPDAGETAIVAAATLAEAHGFIQNLPQGYHTIVGERGQKLSGGQRQRIAIARAILKDPPILILDEATSAVDNETEAAISAALEQITRNRTTIAIAHRLSTIRHAHRIYVMDQGAIVEQGTHESLLHHDGIYANLWRIQTGEKLPMAPAPSA